MIQQKSTSQLDGSDLDYYKDTIRPWQWSQSKNIINEPKKCHHNKYSPNEDGRQDTKVILKNNDTEINKTLQVADEIKKLFKSHARSLSSKSDWSQSRELEPKLYDIRKSKKKEKEKTGEEGGANDEKDVDCGYAWIILTVMFIINASTFGSARAYGLIFEKLARQDEQSRAQAALPFTIMGAVENMGGPLTGYLLARTRSWRATVFVGSCLITLSHLLAALFDSLPGQILTIGFMCGLGMSFVTISSFQINNAYFVRYRSRAFGLGLTGAAFGTFYISPLCEYVLNNYTTSLCYLMLGLILLPNVPLSLLLKRKKALQAVKEKNGEICTISGRMDQGDRVRVWHSIKLVIKNPLFHLIWPTQLLFCWFNFVFGMIIVDFGKDRGLNSAHVSQLIPIWAFGQLCGRLLLGSLVDLKFVSYKFLTVICFASISIATCALNNVQSENNEDIIISLLVFILSMFISNLYILFNGLVMNYMDKSLTTLTIGISSFTGSFFLLPRANIIGYYRDTIGNYDAMLTMFTYTSMTAALVWLLMPAICSRIRSIWMFTISRKNNNSLANSMTNNLKSKTNLKPDVKLST